MVRLACVGFGLKCQPKNGDSGKLGPDRQRGPEGLGSNIPSFVGGPKLRTRFTDPFAFLGQEFTKRRYARKLAVVKQGPAGVMNTRKFLPLAADGQGQLLYCGCKRLQIP